MTWDDEKHKRRPCTCGADVSEIQRLRHERGRWHELAERALELRQRGLTYAAIARELELTRAYVAQRLARLEKLREVAA